MRCESVEFGCLSCALGGFSIVESASAWLRVRWRRAAFGIAMPRSVMLGAPIGACMETECPSEYAALMDCAEPAINGPE